MFKFAFIIAILATPVLAEEDDLSLYGDLNREELTMDRILEDMSRGETSMTGCAAGYLMTKGGNHDSARLTFETCANAGYSAAMSWMAYMEDNGFGGDGYIDPEAAAEWNRQAAEAGDPVGMFNHGIDLMRGWGVEQDSEAGKTFVDQAASQGVEIAERLRGADYDLNEITPDADNWKFSPLF